uniref:Uncharacterized protein n=1 Tax=Knipowitschia caucasica TaxID=637954 RepID=A0AAV2L9E3_KNICA
MRASAEEKYGKELVSIAHKAGGLSEICTLRSSFDELKKQMENVGKQHMQLSLVLREEAKRMEEFRERQKEQRRKFDCVVEKVQKNKVSHFKKTIDSKRFYELRCRDTDEAELNVYKMSNSPAATPRTIEKVKSISPAATPRTIEKVKSISPAATPRTIEKVKSISPAATPRTIEKVKSISPAATPRTIKKVKSISPAATPRTIKKVKSISPAATFRTIEKVKSISPAATFRTIEKVKSISPAATPRTIEKVQMKSKLCKEEAEKAEKQYMANVEQLDRIRHDWESAFISTCEIFQQQEEDRINILRNAMWTHSNHLSSQCVRDDECYENIRMILEKCDATEDNNSFVELRRTGSTPPAPIVFQNFYQNDISTEKLGSSRFVGVMKRFSDLLQNTAFKVNPEPVPQIIAESTDAVYASIPGHPEQDQHKFKVMYDYMAQGEDELTVCVGESVVVTACGEDGWWTVQCNGKTGLVPGSYLTPESSSLHDGQ